MFRLSDKWTDYNLAIIRNQFGALDFDITNFVRERKGIISQNGKILDLGCGAGRHTFYFSQLGFDLYASDIDCTKIRANCAQIGASKIHIREHSFTSIPYPDSFFDAVCCMSTLHHAIWEDIQRGTDEVYRTLKSGGIFLFDFLSVYDHSFGLGKEIEKNTFVGSREGEEGVAHHYANEQDIQELSCKFSDITVNKSIYHFSINKSEFSEKVFDVTAIK